MPTHPTRHPIAGLLGWLAACFVTAGIAAYASVNAVGFYGQLAQPSWAPPAWLFGPVWSVLYVMMAVAAWLVWRRHGFAGAGTALALFIAQLVANALWTWLFFVWHQGALAFAEIVLLWLLLAANIHAFWRLQRPAAVLLLPYLAWVSFATALTWAMWRLNPASLG